MGRLVYGVKGYVFAVLACAGDLGGVGSRIMSAAKEKYLFVRELVHDVLVAGGYVQVRKTQKCILQKLWKRALSVPETATAYFRDHSCDVPSIARLHWMHGTPYRMRKSPSVH